MQCLYVLGPISVGPLAAAVSIFGPLWSSVASVGGLAGTPPMGGVVPSAAAGGGGSVLLAMCVDATSGFDRR